MPGKVKVKILAGRNLPVMDRSSDTTDAFVEIRLGEVTYKTDVFRKSLNPAWNSEWFRFESDDLELQDEPLQVRIMDYDAYSANDAVGKVYIDLNPLLLPSSTSCSQRTANVSDKLAVSTLPGGSMMSGWVPIFDTMHGIRGELNLIVKVELFSDLNRFRKSSCGVHFFRTAEVPEGYKIQFLPGFVEELVANDDPEYKWIDKIRTPRASNEARQLLFMKLSGEVRRKIGLKTLELGANAVIGYKQFFDLEGESGIVVRGIGTAVTLTRVQQGESSNSQLSPGAMNQSINSPRCSRENSAGKEVPLYPEGKGEAWLESPPANGSILNSSLSTTQPLVQSPSLTTGPPQNMTQGTLNSTIWTPAALKPPRETIIYSKMLETDIGASMSGGSGSSERIVSKQQIKNNTADMCEYPFLTLTSFPPGFLAHIGGMVSAKSVKLLEELDDREDGDTREAWWTEIRQEIRSHAQALGCNVIVGYQERSVICDDVIILSGSGTGAVSNISMVGDADSSVEAGLENKYQGECHLCHIPYLESSVPFPIKLGRCNVCERGKVPDILLTTIEPPPKLEISGRGGMLQARVLKLKKDLKNENNAREVSDALPFLEYEIHRQIVNKLKVTGMNSIFGLEINLALSERTIVAIATGTAVYLAALPAPSLPKITSSSNMFTDQNQLNKVQSRLIERVQANKKYYGIEDVKDKEDSVLELEDIGLDMELTNGNKETCVLEVDDSEDADIVDGLLDIKPPQGMQVITVKTPIGVNISQPVSYCQTFTQVYRGKQTLNSRDLGLAAQHLFSSMCFKLRKLRPCLVSSLQWDLKMDEENELQLNISGVVLSLHLDDPLQLEKREGLKDEGDLMFKLDCIQQQQDIENNSSADVLVPPMNDVFKESKNKIKPAKLPKFFLAKEKEMFGINVTPLPFIPGARIEHHLGNLNFFFIRESTSVRELGGISKFVQGFMSEVLGILRAHVAALGGNAVTSYFMSECVLNNSTHKNQAQCLINVGGDCVVATYVPPE